MPKYVVAEQMHAIGCFCFQTVERYHEIALFCQDRGASIIVHRSKSKDACGCGINFQVDRNATLKKELEGLGQMHQFFIHVTTRRAIMVVRVGKGQRSTYATQQLCRIATYAALFPNETLNPAAQGT